MIDRALAPCVRRLPVAVAAHREPMTGAGVPGRLRLAIDHMQADCDHWDRVMADAMATGTPTSRSYAGDYRVITSADFGRLGVDIESLDRMALNAPSPHDAWLADTERPLIETAADPVMETACHWVLKEAYGKALGVGLQLPLAALSFQRRGAGIMLRGSAAPGTDEGWQFRLYRYHDAVLALAYAPPVMRSRHWRRRA